MKRMSRMDTKKTYSWWWDSHISPKNSQWMEDNIEEMDRCVTEMLKLIEQEGDSFAKKAEMYYQKRPMLTAHVEDFYRMYRALAERYDNITGELRKNIPSELQSQGSNSGSDLGAQTPELIPERRPPRRKPGPRAAGFDFFLGSGGSYNHSRRRNYVSTSSSESDTNSENGKSNQASMHQRIVALENELLEVKGKLHEYEAKESRRQCGYQDCGDHIARCSSITSLDNYLMDADEKFHDAVGDSLSLAQKLEEENADFQTNLISEEDSVMEKPVAIVEAELSQCNQEIENLYAAPGSEDSQVSACPPGLANVTEECKSEISSLSEPNYEGKTLLEAEITSFEGSADELKREIQSILQEKLSLETKLEEQELRTRKLQSNAASFAEQILQYNSTLEAQVSGFPQSHASLEAKVTSLEDEIKELESQKMRLCDENDNHTAELNKCLDELMLKINMLATEKEELGAKVSTLIIDVQHRDTQICQMNESLHQLHLEHAKIITETEISQRACDEMRLRVNELEEEVERQKLAALDSAEEKREAIRQLCFSLEHYRDGYYHLRKVMHQGHKWAAVIAR